MEYNDFLKTKKPMAPDCGFDPKPFTAHLYPFQEAITSWAIRKGRAAIFADCGLGKTPIQLEWAHQVCAETGGRVLVVAPLAVSHQTVREGQKFGIPVHESRTGSDLADGINITNYERLERYNAGGFAGIVLDESSILKGFEGKFRKMVTEFARGMRYRLACTATPAPNDLLELANHSEFLSVLTGKEIIGRFFIQDGNTTHAFRLRKHAEQDFWKWIASWAIAVRKPSDLGFTDDAFTLPNLNMVDVILTSETMEGYLFPITANTLTERRAARVGSLAPRVGVVAQMVNNSQEQWLVWCDLNKESDALRRAITGAVEVTGSDPDEHKERSLVGFQDGTIRVLVTKPSIAGFGMNWQNCHNVAFVGLSDSYEQFYQAIRRCWRFGQTQEVNCYVITSEAEGKVVENIKRKERQASDMFTGLVEHMKPYEIRGPMEVSTLGETMIKHEGEDWTLYEGDAMETIKLIAPDSVGLTVFSPPFPGMYAYSDSTRDVGNCRSIAELITHFEFMVDDLFRITMPGRSCAIHLTQEPVFKGRDGYVGLRDFRGHMIRLMEDHGWIYYGEVTIDKDPQVKASRTKDHSLLFKTLGTDSSDCRMALADYMIQFKKPGTNTVPVAAGHHPRWNANGGWITSEEWIEWAAPVWYRATQDYPGGIRETDVLNVRVAREENDERHLCPLQIGVIERAVKLWSAPGDTVFSPFAGIGSEGFVALGLGRKFVGCEIKPSYVRVAIENMNRAKAQMSLFHEAEPCDLGT